MSIVGDIAAESAKYIGFVAAIVLLDTFIKGMGAFGRFLKGTQGKATAGIGGFGKQLGEDMRNRNKLRDLNGAGGRLSKVTGRGMLNRYKDRKEGERKGVQGELGRATHGYLMDEISNNPGYAKRVAGASLLHPEPSAAALGRVKAAATAAHVKEFIEEVNAEKNTMSKNNGDQLWSMMVDTSASEARRSAAGGQLMKVGTAEQVREALEYLSGNPVLDDKGNVKAVASGKDKSIASIQQQVVSDIGARKPISLGAGDMAALNTGSYTGSFSSKIEARLTDGKLSAAALATATPDELDQIRDFVAANGAAIKADPSKAVAAAAMKELENDIDKYRKNTLISQPAYEIGSRMDTLHGLL